MTKLAVTVIGLAGWLCLPACSSSSPRSPADGGDGDAVAAVVRKVDCSGACAFGAVYTVSTDGYFAQTADKLVLSPAQAYQHLAFFHADGGGSIGSVMCAPAIPPCTEGGPVGACDIAQDLADSTVQAVLAQPAPPFFGPDTRGTDGNAFSFRRDDGHGFEVGEGACATSSCVPVPAPIARLKADLVKLDSALIASPACTGLGVRLTPAGGG